ncbi:hypothetical protein J6590_019424 [Homalodisca vitripennis]|nr:hypothetical protein J6590_019424 [Homalodisca vitripennis]
MSRQVATVSVCRSGQRSGRGNHLYMFPFVTLTDHPQSRGVDPTGYRVTDVETSGDCLGVSKWSTEMVPTIRRVEAGRQPTSSLRVKYISWVN